MGFFGNLFKGGEKKSTKANEISRLDNFLKSMETESRELEQTETSKYLSAAEIELRNKEFAGKFEQVNNLFTNNFYIYNSKLCQCAYPRFQQIIGIDCAKTGKSYKCYETELLINLSKINFDIEKSEITDECTNEKWICKKCGSAYEYGWSDFSIYVERQKLELKKLKVNPIGKPIIKPIPLYLGLMGHSYPPFTEMTSVDFATFEFYITEK